MRWMLGSLAHFHPEERVPLGKMPELERFMLHRLSELDRLVRRAYEEFDYKRIFAALNAFMTTDLSAFYSISARMRSTATRSPRDAQRRLERAG